MVLLFSVKCELYIVRIYMTSLHNSDKIGVASRVRPPLSFVNIDMVSNTIDTQLCIRLSGKKLAQIEQRHYMHLM